MTINLLQEVQQKLGYPDLCKIDPNTQKIILDDSRTTVPDRFSQAVLPATLVALYTYGSTAEGAESILHGDVSGPWAQSLFADNREPAIRKIAAYAGHSFGEVADAMNKITQEAIRIIREKLPATADIADVQGLLADAKTEILVYLPPDLQVGELLADSTLDDRTHKMEGPVSSLMNAIGASFSGADTDETDRSK